MCFLIIIASGSYSGNRSLPPSNSNVVFYLLVSEESVKCFYYMVEAYQCQKQISQLASPSYLRVQYDSLKHKTKLDEVTKEFNFQ